MRPSRHPTTPVPSSAGGMQGWCKPRAPAVMFTGCALPACRVSHIKGDRGRAWTEGSERPSESLLCQGRGACSTRFPTCVVWAGVCSARDCLRGSWDGDEMVCYKHALSRVCQESVAWLGLEGSRVSSSRNSLG